MLIHVYEFLRAPLLILTKFDMNVMPVSCFLACFKDFFIRNNNMADLRGFEVEATLAPHNVGS
jgi:hypothetical protein